MEVCKLTKDRHQAANAESIRVNSICLDMAQNRGVLAFSQDIDVCLVRKDTIAQNRLVRIE